MAKKKSVEKQPVGTLLPPTWALKVDDLALEYRKFNEIADSLCYAADTSEAEKDVRRLRALELYQDFSPEDGLEGMLSAQMVSTHFAAQECMRRAAHSQQSIESRDMNLKHAQKLMALFTHQVAALDKHRGKGQQKVTVEHVNVEAGGQAVVGNVEMGRSNQSRNAIKEGEPSTIENAPEVPLPSVKPKSKVGRRRSK
jgi:hypothetical protein